MNGIFDPKNDHVFSAARAVAAFEHVEVTETITGYHMSDAQINEAVALASGAQRDVDGLLVWRDDPDGKPRYAKSPPDYVNDIGRVMALVFGYRITIGPVPGAIQWQATQREIRVVDYSALRAALICYVEIKKRALKKALAKTSR